MGAARPQPTVALIREVCQPESVTGRDVEHWTAGLYLRRLSPYVTLVLLRLGASPNAVTGLMIAAGAAAGLGLLVPGLVGAVLAVVLGQLQMLLDCCDGEVARWQDRRSAAGVFLDRVGHHVAELSIALCLGVRADAPALGAVLAALVVLNRAVNDMVHASRAAAGLPPLATLPPTARTPRPTAVARLRRAARLVPVHRALHSVELTLVVLVAAVLDLVAGRPVTTWVLVGFVVGAAVTVVGHVVAVLTSDRLR